MDAIKQTTKLCLLVIPTFVSGVYGREICYAALFGHYYCDDGYYCCDNNTRCCPTFGIGTLTAILSAFNIITCCVFVVICYFVKKNKQRGQIIQQAQPDVVIVVGGNHKGPNGYGQPMYGQPMHGQPPSYGQQPYTSFRQQPSGEKAGTSDPAESPRLNLQ